MQPPVAPKIPHSVAVHGETLSDNWFYLRDRTHPATLPYLEAENRFTAQVMEPAAALETKIYEEMVGRIQETDATVPAKNGAYEYYTRMEQGKQYAIQCRRPLPGRSGSGNGEPGETEEILLDCNALAEGHVYFSMAYDIVSPDGTLLAFAVDTDGSEVYTLRFKDLNSGGILADEIPNVYYSGAWTDNSNFFYTTLDETKRPYRLWRHRIGSEVPDELVYEETDGRFNITVERSRSGKFLLLTIDSHATSEVRYLSTGDSGGQFRALRLRAQDVEYYAEHQGGFFWIRTDENAINFRLMRAPDGDPTNWTEVLPHRDDVSIEGLEGFRNHLVVVEREHGLKQLRVADTRDGFVAHVVEFDEPTYTLFTEEGNEEYETSELRFMYTSLVTPRSVYDYDMASRTRALKKRFAVLGGYDASNYTSERIFATAPDGVQIPVSLVYRKGMVRDSGNPLYLYGYGSYGIITEPAFSSERISLLDRGYIYAIAHIRGSGDMGRRWYEDGKLLHKRNSFTDFIACGEHLIAEKYTSANRLDIAGGSAGGLLMGAVMNLRPNLFRTVVAHVPFVDVVNTMLDETLPLTIAEYEEWGNPNEREFFEYMRSYSPYDNVEPTAYPNVLVTAGLNDPRVSYWEPAKWVAKLRDLKTDANVIVLKTNMGAGHGGPSGRYSRLKEKAFEYAFLLTR
jgi:oligopeptidase B